MKTSRRPTTVFGFELMVVFALLVTSVPVEASLQIEKAICGANGSWFDVTACLQGKVEGDTLFTKISQPFAEIGGDPAFGKPKHLIIDYRSGSASRRLALEEKYPVAFEVELPSSKAVAPGTDPKVTAFMEDAGSHMKRVSISDPESHMKRGRYSLINLACSISIVSMIWAIDATIELLKVKKRLGVTATL
jgi:hypothetical protein